MAKRKPSKKPGKRITQKQDSENLPAPALPQVQVGPEIDDDEPTDEEGLNPRRKLFVQYLTTTARGNATKAAELAGYASDNRRALQNTASRLLGFAGVQQAIARRLAALESDPEAVRNNVATLCRTDMSHFLRVGPDGNPVMDWEAAAAAGAIGQVREWIEEGFVAGQTVTILKRKFKLYDRLRALELMAKLNGQLIERHRHEGEVKFNPITFDGDKQANDSDAD